MKAEAESLGLFVGLDWAHEPALSARDAYQLVDGSARRNLEHENAWHAHTVALERWQAEREAVRRQAFQEAWKSAVRRNYNNGPANDQGHAAAREAVAAFEKANPEPRFVEPDSGRLQSWINRVKAGVR